MNSRSPLKRKNLKLDVNPDLDFTLIGISSHENDYRLVWAINNYLRYDLIRTENLVVHQSRIGHDAEFSKFMYVDEERLITYYLISNRCPDGFLFPEIRNIDFLIQVVGEIHHKSLDMLLRSLKKIEIISGAYIISNESLKDVGRIMPA